MFDNIKNRFKINITKRQQSTRSINVQSIIPESVQSTEIDTDYSSSSSATQDYVTSDVDIDTQTSSSNSSIDNDKSLTNSNNVVNNDNVNVNSQMNCNIDNNNELTLSNSIIDSNNVNSLTISIPDNNSIPAQPLLTPKYSLSIFARNESIPSINSLPVIDTTLIEIINSIDLIVKEIVSGYRSFDGSEYNDMNKLFEYIKPATYMKAPTDQILIVGRKFAPLSDKLEYIVTLDFGELLMLVNKQIDSNLYNLLNIIYNINQGKLLTICYKEFHKPKHHVEAYSQFDGLLISNSSITIPNWLIDIANEYLDNLLELDLMSLLTITNEMVIIGFRKILFDSGLLTSKIPQMTSTPTMLSLLTPDIPQTIRTKRFSITKIDKNKTKTDVINDIINEIIPDDKNNEFFDLTITIDKQQ